MLNDYHVGVMGGPQGWLIKKGGPWSHHRSHYSLTLVVVSIAAVFVESCRPAIAVPPDFDDAFQGTVDVFFRHSQDNQRGGVSTERSIRPHLSNEALPSDENLTAQVALQERADLVGSVDKPKSATSKIIGVRGSTGGTGYARAPPSSAKGTLKKTGKGGDANARTSPPPRANSKPIGTDWSKRDETDSAVTKEKPSTPSDTSAETPAPSKPTGKAAAPSAPTDEAAAPSAPTGKAAAPSKPTVKAAAPSKPTGKAAAPSKPTGKAAAPSKPTGKTAAPSKRTGKAAAPVSVPPQKSSRDGTQKDSSSSADDLSGDELSKLFDAEHEADDAALSPGGDDTNEDLSPFEDDGGTPGDSELDGDDGGMLNDDLVDDSTDLEGQSPKSSLNDVNWTTSPDDPDWKFGLAPERKRGDKEAAEKLSQRREERSNRMHEDKKEEATVQNLYNRAKTVCPGVNYLGIGYDSVKANPLGDPNLMGDPGLRSPILRFEYRQDENGVTSDLTGLQPIGAYCRPFVACKQSENLSEVATLSDYVKELETDASLGGGDSLGMYSFSASAGYREEAKKAMAKKTRTFMLKTYCLRYEAGIAQTSTFKWNYTVAFVDALGFLPETFDGSLVDGEGCTPSLWRENRHDDACKNTNVRKWMDFIDQFGTHYTVRLFAGGKMTHQITMKNSDIGEMKSSGVDVKASLKANFSVAKVNASFGVKSKQGEKSNMKEYHYDTETLIMGGRVPQDVSDPESMAEWSDSVEELPMPVKLTLQPLDNLIPANRRDAFRSAALFYSECVGMSKNDMSAIKGKAESVGHMFRKASQVVYAGEPPGFAMCPEHKRVLLGFALQVNFLERPATSVGAIKSCTPGRDKCDGYERDKMLSDEARIFVLCGDEPVTGLDQVVVNTHKQKAVAVCPEGSVIATGFTMSLAPGRHGPESLVFLPCRAGLTTCTGIGSLNTEQNLAWIVCVDESTTGLELVVNVGIVGDAGAASKSKPGNDGMAKAACPSELGAALGFAGEFHSRMADVRDHFKECADRVKVCALRGKGVDKAGFYSRKDSHALFAFMMCAEKKPSSGKVHTEKQAQA